MCGSDQYQRKVKSPVQTSDEPVKLGNARNNYMHTMPAYAGFDSFASSRRTAESIYYSAKEFDSADESDCMRPLPIPMSRRPSLMESLGPVDAIFNRRYVDPWDMENYIYVRKWVSISCACFE